MKKLPKIDIHTHRLDPDSQAISIYNCRFPGLIKESLPPNTYLSAGVHPWDIKNGEIPGYTDWIDKMQEHPLLVAIGESGLDTTKSGDLSFQSSVIRKHADWADKNNMPLILHVVKRHTEIMAVRKTGNYQKPWIFHGYRGNKFLTPQLVPQGFYFSFGQWIIDYPDEAEDVILQIPDDKIFCETDASEYSISDIYRQMAEIKGISEDRLSHIIFNNAKKCFPKIAY